MEAAADDAVRCPIATRRPDAESSRPGHYAWYDADMSEGKKATPAAPIDAQLLAYLNGPPPQDENGVDLSLITAVQRMTLEERAERHYQARAFAERMRDLGREVRGQLHPIVEADV
jgi:hypothetical protein